MGRKSRYRDCDYRGGDRPNFSDSEDESTILKDMKAAAAKLIPKNPLKRKKSSQFAKSASSAAVVTKATPPSDDGAMSTHMSREETLVNMYLEGKLGGNRDDNDSLLPMRAGTRPVDASTASGVPIFSSVPSHPMSALLNVTQNRAASDVSFGSPETRDSSAPHGMSRIGTTTSHPREGTTTSRSVNLDTAQLAIGMSWEKCEPEARKRLNAHSKFHMDARNEAILAQQRTNSLKGELMLWRESRSKQDNDIDFLKHLKRCLITPEEENAVWPCGRCGVVPCEVGNPFIASHSVLCWTPAVVQWRQEIVASFSEGTLARKEAEADAERYWYEERMHRIARRQGFDCAEPQKPAGPGFRQRVFLSRAAAGDP